MPAVVSVVDRSKTDCALSVTGPYESTAIVTGPMPRKPKATRPKAKIAGAIINSPVPIGKKPETQAATPMRPAMARPIQYAEKLPAMKPERMLSDAPPSRDAVTTSRTWRDSVDVKTFTSSGMIAPASVPHVMIVDSFHHIVESPPRFGINRYETTYVTPTERIDVSHTSDVSGASKFILSALPKRAFATASLMKYETAEVMIMRTRMTKIQTSSCTCTVGLVTARRMNVMSATPVTPYVSNPSAVGPTESPALSPTQSAMTPGLRASSSLMLKTIFMRSEPMSAIFVKMPPAIRSAAAPSDSPMAKPMNTGPAYSAGTNRRMQSMITSSVEISSMPMDIPARSGIEYVGNGLPRSDANAVREFANVLMRMPNHATP